MDVAKPKILLQSESKSELKQNQNKNCATATFDCGYEALFSRLGSKYIGCGLVMRVPEGRLSQSEDCCQNINFV